ncbi:MAG: hypothetical protein JNM90_05770 [Burkholderiales bacterium]|nr:hypothetical protein [Burkholderiales bacterium]
MTSPHRSATGALFIVLGMLAAPSPAAAPLTSFAERNGCRVLGSPDSIARLREIAGQGSVAWDGRCRDGYIDGPGGLLHQGSVVENGRTRRYAFLLSGTAENGRRVGTWRRETFNMFEDSNRYWTSLATITYVDGISRGSPRLLPVRSNADFTAAFQRYLAGVDRELATRKPADEARDPAPAASAAPAPPPSAGRPLPAAAVPTTPTPAAPTPAAPTPVAPTPVAPTPVAPTPAAAAPVAPAGRSADGAPAAPAAAGGFQGSGLRVDPAPPPPRLGGLGPARSAPTPAGQQVLEQTGACYLDQINDRIIGAEAIHAAAAEPLRISGWAADPRRPDIPDKAWLRVYDRGGGPGLLLDMPRNVDRPDVARALGDAIYARAGFAVDIAPGRLAAGDYTVAIVQQLGADLAVCTRTARLILR